MYAVYTIIPTLKQDITLCRYAYGNEYASFALGRAMSPAEADADCHLSILGS